MSKTRLLAISELSFLPELYPRARGRTWWRIVYRYAEEMKAGAVFPSIVVGKLQDRLIVVDGWHRCKALKLNKEEYVKAEIRSYESERELFADAVRLNSSHGIQLCPRDKTRIIAKLEEFKFTSLEISELVRVPIGKIKRFKIRTLRGPKGIVHLKSPIAHLVKEGHITEKEAMDFDQSTLSVRRIQDLLIQLIVLIEGEVFPWEDESVGELASKLYEKLGEHLAIAKVTAS